MIFYAIKSVENAINISSIVKKYSFPTKKVLDHLGRRMYFLFFGRVSSGSVPYDNFMDNTFILRYCVLHYTIQPYKKIV